MNAQTAAEITPIVATFSHVDAEGASVFTTPETFNFSEPRGERFSVTGFRVKADAQWHGWFTVLTVPQVDGVAEDVEEVALVAAFTEIADDLHEHYSITFDGGPFVV